jgi:hypothetical protein
VITGEEESDMADPPVSSEEKEKKKKKTREREGRRGWAGSAGSVWLSWIGPRVGPVASPSLFFCSETFSNFCFVICLIIFTF